jgi:hypothetical protein
MRIRWTVPAADDLESIKNYLQRNYPHFAEPTVRTIYQRVHALKSGKHHAYYAFRVYYKKWKDRSYRSLKLRSSCSAPARS